MQPPQLERPPVPPGAATPPVQGAPATLPPPLSASEISRLEAIRGDLSNQLTNIRDRREEVASQLRGAAPGVDRAGIESQLAVLDSRINAIERELESTRQQLTFGRPAAVPRGSSTVPPPDLPVSPGQLTGISVVFTIFFLFPISIAIARRLWHRAPKPVSPAIAHDTTERLQRMEQAIDTVAIEVERISENQRYVTRILTENGPAADAYRAAEAAPRALNAGSAPAQPLPLQQEQAVRVRREVTG